MYFNIEREKERNTLLRLGQFSVTLATESPYSSTSNTIGGHSLLAVDRDQFPIYPFGFLVIVESLVSKNYNNKFKIYI